MKFVSPGCVQNISSLAAGYKALVLAAVIFLFFAALPGRPADTHAGQGYIQGRPVAPEVYQAATLVNEGLKLIRENRNDEAVGVLTQATSLAPDLPEAHHNLGLALAKVGRFSEAIEQLRAALELRPDFWSSWLTLGGLYQSTGQLDEAVKTYQDFLKRFPKHGEANRVASLLKGLEAEASKRPAAATAPGGADHYLDEVTREGVVRWPAARMPLKIFIRPGDGVPGYRPAFRDLLTEAFREWESASGGLVRFSFVSSARKAEIECSWTNDPRKLSNQAEAGEAVLYSDSNGLSRGTVVLLTVPLSPEVPLTDNAMRTICLHEIGHILGLAGHTRNPEDVMFYSGSLTDEPKQLSARDRNTLVRLYSTR